MAEYLEMQGIDPDATFEGKGCDRCRNLGSGRRGIYELLVVDDHLRDIIARGPNVTEFRRTCTERGMVTPVRTASARYSRVSQRLRRSCASPTRRSDLSVARARAPASRARRSVQGPRRHVAVLRDRRT